MADSAGNAMHTTGEESLRALLHEHDLLGYAEKMIDYGTDSAKRLLKIGRADFDAMADSVSMKPGHVADMLSVIRTKRPVGCDPIDAGPPINTPTTRLPRVSRGPRGPRRIARRSCSLARSASRAWCASGSCLQS